MAEKHLMQCPHCNNKFSFKAEFLGKHAKCALCHNEVQLTLSSEEKICKHCNKNIYPDENVYNCQKCHAVMHHACYEQGGCSTCKLSGLLGEAQASKLIPCKSCSQLIQETARRCPHCNEFQRSIFYTNTPNKNSSKNVSEFDDDKELNGAEILFAVLCGGIACMVGIFWSLQGKEKGGKMIAISFTTLVHDRNPTCKIILIKQQIQKNAFF